MLIIHLDFQLFTYCVKITQTEHDFSNKKISIIKTLKYKW